MLSIGLTSIASVDLIYSIDCFSWRAVDIGVVVSAVKNIIALGVGHSVQDWLEAAGSQAQFGTVAGILWFVLSFLVPLRVYGKTIRLWSMKWL